MAENIPSDSRVNLPAIFIGALATFSLQSVFLSLGVGLAMASFSFASLQSAGGVSDVARFLYSAVVTFIFCAAGGYVAGLYASAKSLFDSRMHGFAAVVLAGVVMGFVISAPANNALRSFTNGTASYFQNAAAPTLPAAIGPRVTVRPIRARTFLLRQLFALEGMLTGAWAGGVAYRRRARRGGVELTGDELRAA